MVCRFLMFEFVFVMLMLFNFVCVLQLSLLGWIRPWEAL